MKGVYNRGVLVLSRSFVEGGLASDVTRSLGESTFIFFSNVLKEVVTHANGDSEVVQ